ncbi:hypothetical protein WAB17_00615 [Parerythrobacter aurantius]|uniref:hypothetical protein n=1 Tax=Parerythrobacter aurantius TaxID=3127706 RepID=UPI0032444ACC
MTTQALGDQLTVDPDLSQQNEANAALGGNTDHSLPAVIATREAIEAAKLEAGDLAGGTANLRPLGEPAATTGLPEETLYSVVELARLTAGVGRCADRATFTAAWAASMPAALPIYPRGNTLEAAGTDAGGCKLRAVRFLTPVTSEDALAFYAAMARRGGFGVVHERAGETDILRGSSGRRHYSVYVRRRETGITDVALVTSGF